MVVKKEVKFVEQDVGEENIGGSIDQDDIGDATIDEEFEELEEHDQEHEKKHEKSEDNLQSTFAYAHVKFASMYSLGN